jgi:hypothetical protein
MLPVYIHTVYQALRARHIHHTNESLRLRFVALSLPQRARVRAVCYNINYCMTSQENTAGRSSISHAAHPSSRAALRRLVLSFRIILYRFFEALQSVTYRMTSLMMTTLLRCEAQAWTRFKRIPPRSVLASKHFSCENFSLRTIMASSKLVLWTGRLLAAIFILAGASKISYPIQVNPSFLVQALKVFRPIIRPSSQ